MKIQRAFGLNSVEWQSLGLIFSLNFIFTESLKGLLTLTSLKIILNVTSMTH